MNIPSMDSGEAITDGSGFLAFVDSAFGRPVPRSTGAACAVLTRGSASPVPLVTSDDRPALRAALADLGRLTDVDCGIGVGISFGYPGTVANVVSGGVDLDRAVAPAAAATPLTIVSFFACILDDRTVLESFRFLETSGGRVRAVAPREEMALTFAFAEAADIAIGSLRDVLGDRRAAPLPLLYAGLLERLGARGRAYLERAVEAREISRALPGAVCEAASNGGIPCSTGPLFALCGDVVDPFDTLERARCANHVIPMLETASAGLVRLGLESRAWFAERAAGVLVSVTCATCDAARVVPVVVTDRRTLARDRIAGLGLDELFARHHEASPRASAAPTDARPCCEAAARPSDLTDLVARNAFDDRLRLAWTCDLRAFLTQNEVAAGLRFNLAGSDASDLFDVCSLRAPQFDVPAFPLAPSSSESR